ncbi:hypothetical protein DENSPDRAFT_875320 [Dentipellis sp. KUC8613]|nr:hypothetical protein DENSPDRAFT_875320 [Dentipellis sp. KUC8613]
MVVGDSALSATDYWRNAEKARPSCLHGSVILSRDVPGAREALELEMEAVRLVMSSLRARYNSLTPINRLPPEILVNIFHFLRLVHPPVNTDLRNIDKAKIPAKILGWIQVTHVCTLWRTLALGTPGLWTHIPFYFLGAEWTDAFLRRSRPAPIRFRLVPVHEDNFIGYNFKKFGRYIERDLPRLQEITIKDIFEDPTRCLSSLAAPAPLLEKLVLMNGPRYPFDDDELIPSMPLNLFLGSAPRLRHIRLQRWYFIPWAALAFSSLVHLEVFQERRDFFNFRRASKLERYQAEFGKILGALENMTSLETLTFEQVFPPPPRGATPQSVYCPAVTLHRLREFKFTDDVRNCELVFRHIAAPRAVRYQVHCIDVLWGRRALPLWLAAIHARIPSPVRRLAILEDPRSVRLDFSALSSGDAESSAPGNPADEGPRFDLSLSAPKHNFKLSLSQMRHVIRVLPFQHLEELHTFYEMKWVTQDWSAVFEGTGHEVVVRHVSASTSSENLVCELLLSEDQIQTLFSLLVSLHLVGVHFGHDLGTKVLEWVKTWAPDRLSRLSVKGRMMDERLVGRLRNVVSETEWDEINGGHETDDESDGSFDGGEEEEEDEEEEEQVRREREQEQDGEDGSDEGPDDEGIWMD